MNKKRLLESYQASAKYRWLLLMPAVGWFYLAVLMYENNEYRLYRPDNLIWGIVVIPLLYAGLRLFVGGLLLPRLSHMARRDMYILLGFSVAVAIFLAWLFPAPSVMLAHNHTLRLIATGEQGVESKGTNVVLDRARTFDGTLMPLDKFQRSGDWELVDGQLISAGDLPGAVATYTGEFRGGLELRLNYSRRAGKVIIELDGQPTQVDLYSDWDARGVTVIRAAGWQGYAPFEQGLIVLGAALYYFGLASLIFMIALVLHLQVLPRWLETLGLVLLYVLIFVFYFGMKRSYSSFNAERVYGDTITYVMTAQQPVTSAKFWFSDRTFPLPLLYKAVGMTPENFTEKDVMNSTSLLQAGFSIISWAILGLAAAGSLRKRWIGPLAFTVVLFFSLGLEISLWDYLMYSESLSFSLLALLLAGWIGLVELTARRGRSPWMYAYLAGLILITVLYAFTRDSNLYFVVGGAFLFVLAGIFKRTPAESRKLYWIYAGVALGLFIFQNMTIRLGDRWQVHIYDNLVRRILVDEEALQYFQEAGLPVNEKVKALIPMGVAEYQGLLFFSEEPAYRDVREWVKEKGQGTYLRYLVDYPEKSLLTPLRSFTKLINGENQEYRYAIFPGQPVPDGILANDGRVYARSPLALVGILVLLGIGIVLYWLGRMRSHPTWLILTALLISIPALAFLIWNGNPLEIERHAVQMGIQFRLAGWLGLLLWLDWLMVKYLPD